MCWVKSEANCRLGKSKTVTSATVDLGRTRHAMRQEELVIGSGPEVVVKQMTRGAPKLHIGLVMHGAVGCSA